MNNVPEFPPSLLIDSFREGYNAYHRHVLYWNPPKEFNKEEWQKGWLCAKESDRS